MRVFNRKKTYCQNCQYPLQDSYNFCPQCGQENSDKRESFWTLVQEYFGNVFAYDSRIARTVRPFLFKPGYLTNQFNVGRRASFVHPLRLYFFVSFFYFFAFTLSVNQQVKDALTSMEPEKADSTQKDRISIMSGGVNVKINSDSAATDSVEILGKTFPKVFLEDKRTTPRQVVDSLGRQQTGVNRYVAGQMIKIVRSDSKSIGKYFSEYFVSKASIIVFLLLPVFALLLKLVYWRRHRYYVEHLTFTLHIHAFAFLILLIQLSIDYFTEQDWMKNVSFLLILIYGVIAARRVYKQNWVKTLVKGFMLSVGYVICFGVFAVLAFLVGGLMY